jgi:hypothetical protein
MANLGESRADYWNAIRSAAEDVVSETRDPMAEGEYDDDAQSARMDALDSWADSMTTYTADSAAILRWSENDDAVFDEGIYDLETIGAGCTSVGELYGRIAYFAVRADILRMVDAIESTR